MELLNFMCQEQKIYDSLTPQVLSSQLITLLAYLSRIHQEKTDETHYYHAKADQIVAYIEMHFLTVTLNEVAWHFHYSPNYISQSLRTETGKSFTEWVQLFRTNLLKIY